jgi:hypothetical protein
LKNLIKSKDSLFSLLGILIVVFMTQARFENPASRNQIAFSKQLPAQLESNILNDCFEDDDFSVDSDFAPLHFQEFVNIKISRLCSHKSISLDEVPPLATSLIISIACLRI